VTQPEKVAGVFRLRKLLASGCGAVLIFGLPLIGFFNENNGLLLYGLTSRAWQLIILAVMLALGAVMVLLWRCPACGHFLGITRTPQHCPQCGARLRP
jgi:hypothetical protein